MSRPFVVTIASEKGGVGKTTIATNLAVYLKALREDLPVTIASFDNHFSVDQMFALGRRPGASVAALLGDAWCPDEVTLGQYGVQYLASERRLTAPAHQSPGWLRRRLHDSRLAGVLVLDTRPVLDWFTEAALLAADLVLVPVKDRAALVNASALRQVLGEAGRADRLWLVPSLVDSRARLNAEVKVHEFLRYAAAERDYQVVDLQISKSPKVESLASGFSSRILPVLTHARQTAVHGQFRELAEFVLAHCERPEAMSVADESEPGGRLSDQPPERLRRADPLCPVCRHEAGEDPGPFYFELCSRRRGVLHRDCLVRLVAEFELAGQQTEGGLLGFVVDGPGLLGPEPRLTMHLLDRAGELVASEGLGLDANPPLGAMLAGMAGRPLDQAYRVVALVLPEASHRERPADGGSVFRSLRRKALRELRAAGCF